MVQVSYPGVYVVERPSGVRTITGVATSIAAFVGYTRKGLPDELVAITSFADFERSFGGLDRDSPLSYAVRQFFANGGTQGLVVRVAAGYATASWVLQGAGPTDVLDVSAASPGAWGNGLRLSVDNSAVRNPDGDFNLVVSQLQADGVTLLPLETHRNLNLDSNSAQLVDAVVNNASAAIRVTRRALAFTQPGVAVSTAPAFPVAPSNGLIGRHAACCDRWRGTGDSCRRFQPPLPRPLDIRQQRRQLCHRRHLHAIVRLLRKRGADRTGQRV